MKARTMLLFAALAAAAFAAEKKPLTNADVIKMVKAELPESTILMAIQANPKQFDSSVEALIELKNNRVPAAVMEAMLQSNNAEPAPAAPSAPAAPPAPAADPSSPLSVLSQLPALANMAGLPAPPSAAAETGPAQAFLIDRNGTRAPLSLISFKILETTAKGASVAALVTESAVTEVAHEAIRMGANNVLTQTGGRFGSTIGNAASGLGSLSKKLFKNDEVTLTYVYAVDGRESARSITADGAKFEINYAELPGADAAHFEPAIIKVSPTPKDWRMLGAMKAKKSEFNDGMPREIKIIEDRIPSSLTRMGRGRLQIAASKTLEPGEYALVLRPVDAKKKFALPDFEQDRGEGAVLRLLWDFKVAAPQ